MFSCGRSLTHCQRYLFGMIVIIFILNKCICPSPFAIVAHHFQRKWPRSSFSKLFLKNWNVFISLGSFKRNLFFSLSLFFNCYKPYLFSKNHESTTNQDRDLQNCAAGVLTLSDGFKIKFKNDILTIFFEGLFQPKFLSLNICFGQKAGFCVNLIIKIWLVFKRAHIPKTIWLMIAWNMQICFLDDSMISFDARQVVATVLCFF